MGRRLETALSLVHEPTALFLDEPTLGLDVPAEEGLSRRMEDMKRGRAAILQTTRYMEEAERLSARWVRL